MKRFVEIFNVAKKFDQTFVVRGFDLTIAQGEFVSIIGPSGCGKSTVLSIVAGLSGMDDGGVVVAGREIQGAGPDRGMVFQAPCLLPWLDALGNVLLGVNRVLPHAKRADRIALATRYLTMVGLGGALRKKPSELSVGMRQRVALARAFALRPKVLLLDEPFGMLDSLTRMDLQDLLVDLGEKDPRTTLMVTHDVDEALYLSDRIAMMTAGPDAKLGGILEVDFPRPRRRAELLDSPRYYELRAQLMEFLEKQGD